MKGKAPFFFVLMVLAFPLASNAIEDDVSAEDDIYLRFRQAQLGDEYRFWHGEGKLIIDEAGKELILNKGSCEIRHYSSNLVLLEEDDENILFSSSSTSPEDAEIIFLANRPGGHGYYSIDIVLPKVGEKRHLKIEIENGERVLYSNLDLEQQNWGRYLTLEGETEETRVRIIYMTKLANRVFSNAFAAFLFMGLLLAYLIYKRRQVARSLRANIREVKAKLRILRIPFNFVSEEDGYRLVYTGRGDGKSRRGSDEETIRTDEEKDRKDGMSNLP